MDDVNDFCTLPHYLVTRLLTPGDSPQHFVERTIAHIWASVDHAHVFRVVLDATTLTWEPAWVAASPEYWEKFLNDIYRESVEDVADVLEGFESLLAEQADND